MATATGFTWTERKNGDVVIHHDGREAAILRGRKAEKFGNDLRHHDAQELMARITGNYKRGNERQATRHPRNS